MKRTVLLLIFSLITWKIQGKSFHHLKVIEEEVIAEAIEIHRLTNEAPLFKHNAKINITSLAFRNISLQYEYNVVKKLNVALGLRFMPKGGIPFLGILQSFIRGEEQEDDMSLILQGTQVSGLAITPEVRWYFGKRAGKGFYIAPFFRYEQTNINSYFNFETEIEGVFEKINLLGNFHNTGMGLLLGAQFNLSERINLDWWILGPYYNATRLNIRGSDFNLSDGDLESFESLFDDITQNNRVTLESNFTNTSASLKAKASLPFIRGFGICIGFRF